jgi:hypothetical protein
MKYADDQHVALLIDRSGEPAKQNFALKQKQLNSLECKHKDSAIASRTNLISCMSSCGLHITEAYCMP